MAMVKTATYVQRTILILMCAVSFVSSQTFKEEQDRFPRVSQARETKEPYLDSLFQSKGIDYPPHRILIVAYKHEQILELWAHPETTQTFTLIKQYPFTAYCGTLGPKRRQGDLQIPEGFYHITHFNPYSNFHLSMLISYPNRSDRILSGYSNLGGEIRIHGSYVTIGCIPIGDNAIEELYITCVDAKSGGQERIPVYIFPIRMSRPGMSLLRDIMQNDTSLTSFWYNLKQGYDIFTVAHRAFDYTIDDQGMYLIANTHHEYPWRAENNVADHLLNRIPPPEGFARRIVLPVSFASWLRNIPLKPGNPAVMLYNGTQKAYQGGHAAIIDIPVGNRDLQQCADAVMRLYSEYNYSTHAYDAIRFQITNGDNVAFRTWINGYRPEVTDGNVTWNRIAMIDSSYSILEKYLEFIYSYAGSYSLSRQLNPVFDVNDLNIGDIFIQGGFPGHAVLIIDMAENPVTKEKVFLLAQSYMPAQDIHILKNLTEPALSPWYRLDFGDTLHTPEWIFTKDDLKRF
jgi:murein L,D-transpeptidase YafK